MDVVHAWACACVIDFAIDRNIFSMDVFGLINSLTDCGTFG